MTNSSIYILLSIFFVVTACSPTAAPEVANAPSSQEAQAPTAAASPLPSTETPFPPTEPALPTATPSPTATVTQTETPLPTATATAPATETATPLPSAMPTTTPTATATPVPVTAAPTATPTSSLPGNPLALIGGSYNGCPLLAPGQYITAPNCSDCPQMDLARWTMGQNLLQVTAAYEANGDIHIILSNGEDVNLNALNFRWLVILNSLSRAIETKTDSIEHYAVDQVAMYNIFSAGTTVGYFYSENGSSVMKVTAICGQ